MTKLEHTLLGKNDWKLSLEREFSKNYFKKLDKFIVSEFDTSIIFPSFRSIFSAMNYTSLKNTRVVIIGQDPYHGVNQANGMCFSVKNGVNLPPSLRNIYKEIESDLGVKMSKNGDLTSWAKQGVLLLNTVLTVKKGEADSHQNQGWEKFTDAIISVIDKENKNVIFLLWGGKAKTKAKNIDKKKHFVLETSHPSPLSSYRGFLGSKHFSKTNELLISIDKEPIRWKL